MSRIFLPGGISLATIATVIEQFNREHPSTPITQRPFAGKPQTRLSGLGTGVCACGKSISNNRARCKACGDLIEKNEVRFKCMTELWAQVPKVNCKGLCQSECGNVPISRVEAEFIQINTGYVPPVVGHGHHVAAVGYKDVMDTPTLGPLDTFCEFLSEHGKCAIYPIRPAICRVYGHADTDPWMVCKHGCVAEGEFTSADFNRVMMEMMSL